MDQLIAIICLEDGAVIPYRKGIDYNHPEDWINELETAHVVEYDCTVDDILVAMELMEPELRIGEKSADREESNEDTVEETEVYVCPECDAEVNDDMFRCPVCDTPLEWTDVPELAEATNVAVMKSLEDREKVGTVGNILKQEEVSTIEDTP